MELLISLEDKSPVEDDNRHQEYRRDLLRFLEDDPEVRLQIGRDYSVIDRFGYTYGSSDYRAMNEYSRNFMLAKGTGMFHEVEVGVTPRRQTPLRFRDCANWRGRNIVPVIVTDSDGVDPEKLLNYIDEIRSGGDCRQDSIEMGGLSKWIWAFSGEKPVIKDDFAVIVQHPNMEACSFPGYSETGRGDENAPNHIKLAFVTKPPRAGFKKPRQYIGGGEFANDFFEGGRDSRFFSEMVVGNSIFITEPGGLHSHIQRTGERVVKVSSAYLGKSPRRRRDVELSRVSGGIEALWVNGRRPLKPLSFHFRMFRA